MQRQLPIWQIEDGLLEALRGGNRCLLAAPTGSGKSTQVPQMILDWGIVGSGRIVILQPRRVAARSLALRVAWERQCALGSVVGYQVRFDDRTSLGTRICYVTEGILLRWLQDGPDLNGVSALIFDEFHERNLLSDLALGLVKHLQTTIRKDLKIVVMSATLETDSIQRYLDDCRVLRSEGRVFPVQIHHLARPDSRSMPEQAATCVEQIIQSGGTGDILVFMPGMAEIQETLNQMRTIRVKERFALMPLHGDLPAEIQDQAFASHALRKIVVATNVAETSVTIDGICHVVDSGLARVARYDPERGINMLAIEEVSHASADQRAGRAGRTAPGQCYRLWTQSNHLNRSRRLMPEVQRADLAEVVMTLHSLGIKRAANFDWIDRPDPLALSRAERLLTHLGALDRDGSLTEIGREMRHLPVHPRFSRMLVEAFRRGCVRRAALCAALVSGRDLLVRSGREDPYARQTREAFEVNPRSDFFTLIHAYEFARRSDFQLEPCRQHGIHAQTARQVDQTYQQILRVVEQRGFLRNEEAQDDEVLLTCLMTGFVDQLCKRRDQGSLECDMTESRSGTLRRESVVRDAPLFVAAHFHQVEARSGEQKSLLGLATAVKLEWLEAVFPQYLAWATEYHFDRTHKRVAALRVRRFHDLAVEQSYLSELDPEAAGASLAQAYLNGFFELPKFRHDLKQFMARSSFLAAAVPELDFPALDRAALARALAIAFRGCALAKEAQDRDLEEAVYNLLKPEQREWLDEMAPTRLSLPDGRSLKLTYPEEAVDPRGQLCPPELQVKLHECFTWTAHPRVVDNRVPIRLLICAPNGKRLAQTDDWLVFKAQDYPRLKATLKQKYPGVPWI